MDLCIYISLFLVVDNAITLFNYFFRDFRCFHDFCDFRAFDLAVKFVKIYMVKFNVSILKRLKMTSFLAIQSKYIT